jgi:hypothetical protein
VHSCTRPAPVGALFVGGEYGHEDLGEWRMECNVTVKTCDNLRTEGVVNR